MNGKTIHRRPRRALALGFGAIILATLVWWVYQPRPLVVEMATVAIGRFEQVIEEDGRLRLRSRYVIAAPTPAQLQRPTLRVGDAVRVGDVVAVLQPVSPQMIDTRTREILLQRVGTAEAAREGVIAQVERLQTALAQADLEVGRVASLARAGFVSASARDQAVLAQRAAPVGVGQSLLELGDLGALEAVIDVLSGEVGAIRPGAAVILSTGNGADSLAGRVERVEPVAFTKVSALGIEEQRVNVIVSLQRNPDADQRVGDGYRVDARIAVRSQDDALLAPSAALVRDGAGWRVFVVEGGRAKARVVHLKDRNADQAWIQDGLQAGEQVVLYPGSMIEDGQPVKPRF